jgi:hypothetical protein
MAEIAPWLTPDGSVEIAVRAEDAEGMVGDSFITLRRPGQAAFGYTYEEFVAAAKAMTPLPFPRPESDES